MTESLELFESAGLVPAQYWQDPNSNYRLWLLRKPPFFFPNKTISPVKGASAPLEDQRFGSVPTRSEWEALWKMWDTITLGMIPEPMLHEKPIDLRHKCESENEMSSRNRANGDAPAQACFIWVICKWRLRGAYLRTSTLNLDSTAPLSLTSTSLVCSTASIRNPRSSRIFSSEVSTRTWRTLTSATYVVRRSIGRHSPWLTFSPTL